MEENDLLDEYRKAYKAYREINDLIVLKLVPEEELEATTAKRDAAKQELTKISQEASSKKLDTGKATQQVKAERTEDSKAEYIAALEAVEEAEALFNVDGNDANKIRLEEAQKRLDTATKLLKGMYLKGEGEFSKFNAPFVRGKEERKAKRAKEAEEKKAKEEAKRAEEEKAKKEEERKKEEEYASATNPLKKKFMEVVSNYIAINQKPAEAALADYMEHIIGRSNEPVVENEKLLDKHSKNMGNREFASKLAKDSLKETFAAILAEAEKILTPEQVQRLKGELVTELNQTLGKSLAESPLSKQLKDHARENYTGPVPNLEVDKNGLLKDKAEYESGQRADNNGALARVTKSLAIIEGIEATRKELTNARGTLANELLSMDRNRASFRKTINEEEPKKGEEAKEEKAKEGTPENELVTRFNEVKGTLFNPAVADKIDSKAFKYATGRDNKPILIVHVEFDGTRTADGKVNKQRATVVITENSVRKISEYVATMDPEGYYQSLPESEGLPKDFSENMDKFLGPVGVDMRPVDKDGKRIEDPEQVPMLSESLVTTKTGMQQLVVNTPKGISAIAVGAKTKALSFEQKQSIELFTEQQKENSLSVRDLLLEKHDDNLGTKKQEGADIGDNNVSMIEAESNMKDFFKILSTDKDSLAVGGTGNFKRDSTGEKIVKQNFMTFVFDKHDKANTEIEDGKDPKPLQFTITERDANGKDTSTTYILGADGKYYDVEAVKAATKMADIDSKGVEASVILNRAGTLGIGDKFVSNVMKRDTAKALAEKAEDEKIKADQLGYLRVDNHRKDRHVNSLELSIHNQATFEAKQPEKPKTTDEQEVGQEK